MGSTGWQARYLARHRLPDSYLVYAQKWFAPLAGWLVEHQKGANRPILVALNGSQGSGKSTVCDYLRETLEHDHGLKAIALSIDFT
jgi:D-glycerate 3-kinase